MFKSLTSIVSNNNRDRLSQALGRSRDLPLCCSCASEGWGDNRGFAVLYVWLITETMLWSKEAGRTDYREEEFQHPGWMTAPHQQHPVPYRETTHRPLSSATLVSTQTAESKRWFCYITSHLRYTDSVYRFFHREFLSWIMRSLKFFQDITSTALQMYLSTSSVRHSYNENRCEEHKEHLLLLL